MKIINFKQNKWTGCKISTIKQVLRDVIRIGIVLTPSTIRIHLHRYNILYFNK